MSTSYYYTNSTRQEWFSASAFGGSGNRHGFGQNLTARAFELLLVRLPGRTPSDHVQFGCWAGDSIAIVGDSDDDWPVYSERFTNLYADLIPFLFHFDGFEELGEVAAKCNRLYAQICHLIVSRQALELESAMKEEFGANYLRRYKDIYPTLVPCQHPRNLRGR
jgi:hypothetical protein